MDYGLTKEQELLRKSAREFFEKECPTEKVRKLKNEPKGFDKKMWKKMAQLGFIGIALPEQYGGMSGEYLELMILMEEMGRNITPTPFYTSICQSAPVLSTFGTESQKEMIFPQVIEQGAIVSWAQHETLANHEASDIQTKAVKEGSDYILNGKKLFVPNANSAKWLLVSARTLEISDASHGITLFLVETKNKGVSIEMIPTAARDSKCEVILEEVKVSESDVIGSVDLGWDIIEYSLQYSSVLKAAEMSGAIQAALSITNKYSKERFQFDRMIGSFQAIQNKLVNMLTESEGLKDLVYQAAWHMNEGDSQPLLNSIVKMKANQAYHRVCFDAVYIHGAIGWSEEMDISLYYLRAKANENDGGGTAFHHARIADELEKVPLRFLSEV